MMRNVTLSDAELIAYSGEHLLYELQMFVFHGRRIGSANGAEPDVLGSHRVIWDPSPELN
jgi:hypothetical protein